MAAVARAGLRDHGLDVRATRDRQMLQPSSWARTGCTPRTRSATSTSASSRARAGAWRSTTVGPTAVVLEYLGLSPQPLFAMGDAGGITAILRDVIKPRAAYLAGDAGRARRRPSRCTRSSPARRWCGCGSTAPRSDRRPGAATRLVPSDIGELNRLYDLGLTSWLPAESVAHGVYYGIRVGGRLVAAAGTHVISRDMRLAAVGNVMTNRDFRNRGYAKIVTGAVTQELLRFCDEVVLNVRSDNPPALAAYRALGYREHVRFEERLVHRRGTLWDSIVSPIRRIANRRSE